MSVASRDASCRIEDRLVFSSSTFMELFQHDAMFTACWRDANTKGEQIKLTIQVDPSTHETDMDGNPIEESPYSVNPISMPASLIVSISYESIKLTNEIRSRVGGYGILNSHSEEESNK